MNILELAILKKMVGGGGESGTNNYNDLLNLPQINGETLAGNKTAANLGLQDALTFDSVPTEDSTNPVESGGVYNALAGKQDNLTFDDDPTENSTNPVKSGGVYNALAGKQDNLTFDGVYNASTNKAATESTVTNAIAGLDVSAYSVDADETISSISETDGKISVNKQDIAIASSQVVAMTGYTKPSSAPATPAIQQGDTANEAIGKLEYKADVNQTNILSVYNQNGQTFNYVNFEDIYTGNSGNISVSNNVITVSGKAAWAKGIIHFQAPAGTYRMKCNVTSNSCSTLFVELKEGSTQKLTKAYNSGSGSWTSNETTLSGGELYIQITVNNTASALGSDVTAVVAELQLIPKAAYDAGFTTYQPYSLPNTLITPELIELCDSGAKNIVKLTGAYGAVSSNPNLTVATNPDTGIVTLSGTASVSGVIYITNDYSNLKGYVLSGKPSVTEDYLLRVYTVSGTSGIANDPGDGTGSVITANDLCRVALYVIAGKSYNNVTIKPMICTKAAFGVSQKFVPYRPNWDLVSSVAPFYSVPINHNMIYRGQNLGATFTDAQHTALSSGNFTDLFLGDYWTKSVTIPAGTYTGGDGEEVTVAAQTVTLKAVIADFDTFYAGYASSYAGINTHHAGVIVTGFNNVVWNKTNSTAGGYVSSLIHKWLVGSVLPQLESWFGSAKVLSHQKLLTNAITGDAASNWAWSSQKISLLSECQLYGMKVWGGSKATNGAYEPGEAFKKLDVFNHIDANLLFGNKNIWCRDIASAERAAHLDDRGDANYRDASNAWIAPAALILLS